MLLIYFHTHQTGRKHPEPPNRVCCVTQANTRVFQIYIYSSLDGLTLVCLCVCQGETGAPGQKGSKGDKGESVSG